MMANVDALIMDIIGATNSDNIGSAGSLDEFDPLQDIFLPAANLVGGEGVFAAAPVSGATITLSVIENWTIFINSIDTGDLTETLNSSTSFTIIDPKTRISLQLTGTDLTTETLFGYTIIATGTITGFTLTQNGVTIASGSDYSITASTLDSVLQTCLTHGNAKPLFDMWFSIPTTVSGTAAVIEASLLLLEPYVDITAVEIIGNPLAVNVAQFKTYESLLNKVTGGFELEDTVANIKAALIASGSSLSADFAAIESLVLTNGATAPLKLTAAQATAASSLLAKIGGNAIVDVHATAGAWTTTGYGNHLTINDIAGVDKITGGGTSEHFVFAEGWGTATISDFYEHYTGIGHDIVTLAKSAFSHGDISLLADAKLSNGEVVVKAGTNELIFTDLTVAELKAGVTAGDFKFV